MSKKAIVLLLFLLVGCGPSNPMSVDLKIVPHESVLAVARANGESPDRDFRGYTIWDGQGNCTIYVISMEEVGGEDTWNWLLGHELRHCFYGGYH